MSILTDLFQRRKTSRFPWDEEPEPEEFAPDSSVADDEPREMPTPTFGDGGLALRRNTMLSPPDPREYDQESTRKEILGLAGPHKIGLGRNIASRVLGGLVGAISPQAGISVREGISGESGRRRQLAQAMLKYQLTGQAMGEDRVRRKEDLDTENIQSQIGERGAQADWYRAHGRAVLNPPARQEREPRTIEVGGRVKQWNPDTERYDIDVGVGKKERPITETPHTEVFGNRRRQFNPTTRKWEDIGPAPERDRPGPKITPNQRMLIERKKNDRLAKFEQGRVEAGNRLLPLTEEEVNAKQQIQDDYENELEAAGATVEKHYEYPKSGAPADGGRKPGDTVTYKGKKYRIKAIVNGQAELVEPDR